MLKLLLAALGLKGEEEILQKSVKEGKSECVLYHVNLYR